MRYILAPNLRLRPVPELDSCVVLAPGEGGGPRLLRLNAHAWLLLELCRAGMMATALREAYREAVVPPLDAAAAAESLDQGLALLLRQGLLLEKNPEEAMP
ncbi:hypothetical protein D9598_16150 [Roseomonas sp. KE0001]|nr:hypothetical protein [Roseomonas sp. KE0001]